MSKKIRVHLFISGRVQGVFFRHNMRREALKLGVTGWVRNLPDGRVEAVIEGEEEKVEKLVEWAHRGPPLARVDEVKIIREDYKGEFETFEIIY